MHAMAKQFEVEKKAFKVKFEGIHKGTWVSITKRFQGSTFMVAFEKDELAWLSK